MHVHRDLLGTNQRLAMLLRTFDKMPVEKQQHLINTADDFLNKLEETDIYKKDLFSELLKSTS